MDAIEVFQDAIKTFEVFEIKRHWSRDEDKISAWDALKSSSLNGNLYVQKQVFKKVDNSLFEITTVEEAVRIFKSCINKLRLGL